MGERYNVTEFEGWDCDECGKFHADSAHYRRPDGWYSLVLFFPWFDGTEGQPLKEWNYCSKKCYLNGSWYNIIRDED